MASGIRIRHNMLHSAKENVPPLSPSIQEEKNTPRSLKHSMVSGKIAAIRDKWDEQVQIRSQTIPTLIQLQKKNEVSVKKEQSVRGSTVFERQRILERLHHEAKSRVDGVGGVSGGVSLWPSMDDMRLSRNDAIHLICLCLFLMIVTCAVFIMYHGKYYNTYYMLRTPSLVRCTCEAVKTS